MDGLTERQGSCLRTIDRYIKRYRRAPTRRELAELTGQKSTHGVNQLVRALAKKGCISIEPAGKARNIKVLHVPPKQLPLLRAPSPRGAEGRSG
ncbi:MAG TPA: hypothetical protein VNA25_09070 [Phycisphaerae bacterium]|nr:hypothetical protein [Phycisphaerae bacterium]